MNWLSIVSGLVQLAPTILNVVSTVEAMLPKGSGVEKKAIVMASLKGVPPELHQAASDFVDESVAHINTANARVSVSIV